MLSFSHLIILKPRLLIILLGVPVRPIIFDLLSFKRDAKGTRIPL